MQASSEEMTAYQEMQINWEFHSTFRNTLVLINVERISITETFPLSYVCPLLFRSIPILWHLHVSIFINGCLLFMYSFLYILDLTILNCRLLYLFKEGMLYYKGIILFFQSSEWHSLDIVHGDERKGKVIYRMVASLNKKDR